MSRYRPGHWDRNQDEIKVTLINLGADVWDTTRVGKGYPDLTVGWCGRTILVEVLAPDAKPYRVQEHRDRRSGWKGADWLIVTSVADLLAQLGVSVNG
jgi:hypothetical protein